MQVGEIFFGTRRPVQRLDVGGQLNQIAGDKPRRQAQVTQQLHQQPGRITARAGAQFQGLLRGLHTRFEADQVTDVFAQALVQGNQEIDAGLRRTLDAVQVGGELRRQRQLLQVGQQFVAFVTAITEGHLLGVGFEEEVERVEHRHLGDQVDFHPQAVGFLREHQARQVIALWVLLPIDEMPTRLHLQRVGEDPCTAVGGRAQANDLRAQFNCTVVAVLGDMVQGDMNRHGGPPASLGGSGTAQDLCHGPRPAIPCMQPLRSQQKRTVARPPCKPCTDLRLCQRHKQKRQPEGWRFS
ncbi:hypothetical protein D3C76_1076620 [compost metagenome]